MHIPNLTQIWEKEKCRSHQLTEDSRCYEQLRVMDEMNNLGSCKINPLDDMNNLRVWMI